MISHRAVDHSDHVSHNVLHPVLAKRLYLAYMVGKAVRLLRTTVTLNPTQKAHDINIMAPYLRSQARNMFIHRLGDWELRQMMDVMEDQELVNFSSTCQRFRVIALDILAYRAQIKPFTNITFTARDRCTATRVGPNGRRNYWLHPLEIINAIQTLPQAARYVKSIDASILHNQSHGFGVPCTHCYTRAEIQHLQTLTGQASNLLQRLGFLPTDRAHAWGQAINNLEFAPALLILLLLCPSLTSLTLRNTANDSHFTSYIGGLTPAMWPVVQIHNDNQPNQLALPPLDTIIVQPQSPNGRLPVTLRSILYFSLVPTLQVLACADVSELDSPILGPMQQFSSVKYVMLYRNSISVRTMVRLVNNMPNMMELMYSEEQWCDKHNFNRAVDQAAYRDAIMSQGQMLLQARNLKVSLLGKQLVQRFFARHNHKPHSYDVTRAIRIGL